MTIQFKTWQRVVTAGNIIAVPTVLLLFMQPEIGAWSRPLRTASYIFIFSLGGLGALMIILRRAGVVDFSYSEADKRTLTYRLSKRVARFEAAMRGSISSRRAEKFERKGRKPNESRH